MTNYSGTILDKYRITIFILFLFFLIDMILPP